jgi:hypothetical protein
MSRASGPPKLLGAPAVTGAERGRVRAALLGWLLDWVQFTVGQLPVR